MLRPESYQQVCETRESVPRELRALLRPEILASIGMPFGAALPEFAAAFPMAREAFDKHWPPAALACNFMIGEWVSALVAIRAEDNVLAWVAPIDRPIGGEFFDTSHAMLPPRWRQLYRWFDSFAVTADSVRPRFWRNSPLGFSGRISPAQFCREIRSPKVKANAFEKKFGSPLMYCWMWTDAGDALFADDLQREGRILHVRHNDLDDVAELQHPEEVLDRFLAHMLGGGTPAAFDFAQHRKLNTRSDK